MDKYIVKFTESGTKRQKTVEAFSEDEAVSKVLGYRDKSLIEKVTVKYDWEAGSGKVWRYGGVFKQ